MYDYMARRRPKNITCKQKCVGEYTQKTKRQIWTRKPTHNMLWKGPRVSGNKDRLQTKRKGPILNG